MLAIQYPDDLCTQSCEHQDVVAVAKQEVLPDRKAQQIARIFKLLGDTTRVKILQSLSQRELCMCDIAAIVEMGQSTVSHQLRLLRTRDW